MSTTRLGTLTIGQAPRADITPIFDRYLPPDLECVHAGVLDGLSPAQIADRFAAVEGEPVLTSRLLDGSAVVLGKSTVRPAVQQKLNQLQQQGCNMIALLCTGEFHGLQCQHAWLLEPDLLVPPVVAALAGDRQVGIMVPLPAQMVSEGAKWQRLRLPPRYAAASPYTAGAEQLTHAALTLRDQQVDVIVMDCMGYTEQHRQQVRAATGLPVILSNALLARLIAGLL